MFFLKVVLLSLVTFVMYAFEIRDDMVVVLKEDDHGMYAVVEMRRENNILEWLSGGVSDIGALSAVSISCGNFSVSNSAVIKPNLPSLHFSNLELKLDEKHVSEGVSLKYNLEGYNNSLKEGVMNVISIHYGVKSKAICRNMILKSFHA